MRLWTVILAATAGTVLLRVTLLVALRNVILPPAVDRLSGLVLPVAIAAILGATLHGAALTGPATDVLALLVGAVATALVVRRTGSVLAAVGAGLAVVAGVSYLC
jgi:branched-subunit amino acid transport protein